LQKIESLENAVAALKDERNEWREQAKAASVTIEKQAAALAAATTASARAITQADEMRRQLGVLEHTKADPPTDLPEPAQAPAAFLGASARFWVALALAATIAAAWLWLERQH